MRTSLGLWFALLPLVTACGGKQAPPADSPQATAPPKADEPNRPLGKSECESLSQTIVDACNNRGNDRSSGMDGWCSDMVQRNTGDGTWVDGDCLKHFKYMDFICFQGAKNAHAMMDCDRTVDRAQ